MKNHLFNTLVIFVICSAQFLFAQRSEHEVTSFLTPTYTSIAGINQSLYQLPRYYSSAPIFELMELYQRTDHPGVKFHYLEQLTFYRSILSITDSVKTQLLDVIFENQGLSIHELKETYAYVEYRLDEIEFVMNDDFRSFIIESKFGFSSFRRLGGSRAYFFKYRTKINEY